jgi:cytochrome c-type biogenesis protein CcsB
MITMYMSFFDASLVIAGLATVVYLLYTIQQHRAAQSIQQRQVRHRGHRGVVNSAPSILHQKRERPGFASLALQGISPIARFLSTTTNSLSHQFSPVTETTGRNSAKASSYDRAFEVADVAIPVTVEVQTLGRLGSFLMGLLSFFLLMAMLFRTLITHHAPWVNLYEASIALAGFLALAYTVFEIAYKSRALGLFASGIALFFLLFALWVGAAFDQAIPLDFHKITPALQDNPILAIHVSMMIISYALFVIAFACGVLMLVQGDGQVARFSWLPGYEAVDELGYKAVTIGFPLLALGIILGAWWANYAWGHYWSWDPKETSALITWLVYAIYLHARGLRGMRGRTMGWLLVAGFAATLFTYFGVSFLLPGLHSYGGVQ